MYAVVQPCCIYFDVSKYGGITSYDITFCVGFFQNDDNQVNIGLLWLGLVSYHTIHHIIHVYGENSAQSPRRMFTTACSFASHFRQQMAQNADLPSESCKNFSWVSKHHRTPALCQKQGCSVSRLPLFWLTQLSDSSRAPDTKQQTAHSRSSD